MNDVALIIAAHGSRREPSTNAETSQLACALASCGRFDEVVAAFHQGDPGFADAIDGLQSTRVVVVPYFASDGYFCRTVLPEAIARSARHKGKSIEISPAVGTHALTTRLVSARVENLLHDCERETSQTTVIIVGHGTKRDKGSALSTINLAAHMRRQGLCARVSYAFLDQEPFIKQALGEVSTTNVVAIPFFIGQSSHADVDVPRRLGLDLVEDESLPVQQNVNGISIVCDVPVGTYPGMVNVIGALADEARRELAAIAPRIDGALV